jgi:uncharacterized protein (DUF58 family)
MRRIRLLVVGTVAVFGIGMLLWLTDFILRAQAAIALFSPFLAQLFLGGVILLAMVAIGLGLYYLRLFLRPRPSQTVTLPADKTAATAVAISGVEQQIAQIQSDVAQQALCQNCRP